MDAKLKADWVKALRSGEYRQTKFNFEDGEGFCCLGVLCKIAGRQTELDDGGHRQDNWRFVEGEIMSTLIVERLVDMNDEIENSFSQIADYIEKEIA